MITGGRDQLVGEGVLLFRQWHLGKSAATPLFSVAGRRGETIVFSVKASINIPGWGISRLQRAVEVSAQD
ncbi:hypothetical protein AMECASPLE_033055 [Ameca splendens]|uniref:Uncharacterized protein n=1 Tax=Ameca splendens TaxID=208324 RepID=A0ABV0XJP3_9TELE